MIPLVVIDAKTDRSAALKSYLSGTGVYRVVIIESPQVTLNRAFADSPGVVIAVQDEAQEGVRLLKSLRDQKIDLPVIILANTYDPDAFRLSVSCGAEYLVMAGVPEMWYPVLIKIIEKVSAVRKEKDKVEFLEKKLNLVGSVTRHDVLNQLTAVSGYTELLEMTVEDPQLKSYIEKERFALDKIRRQFQFAKDYQNLGNEPPVWQTVSSVVRRGGDMVALKGITVTDASGDISIFADITLEKAFAQLLDNVARHGQTATAVRISVEEKENGAVLVFEDNGKGIPEADKKRIFERGFGKNTGWGLFLVREILGITGITITETGIPGKGARFEIKMPAEMYRKR